MNRLLLVILLVSVCIPAYAWTRGDIITEVRNQTGDTNSDTAIQIWTDTILHSRIDQAEEEIQKLTRCMVDRSTVATSCGTGEYQMPDAALLTYRVMYDTDGSSTTTKYVELAYNTIDGLDNKYNGWEYTSSGTPQQYYYRATI